MKKIDIDEMKSIQLNILTNVAEYCEKNNIRYFLSGGTMLGAVRHHGFIPWDDDIDIQMPRPDYERFIHNYKHEYYEVCCWDLDPHYLCTYAKVSDKRTVIEENGNFGREIGINIDVFPVDGLPAEEKQIAKTVKIMKIHWGLVVCATVKDISKRTRMKKIEISLMRLFYKVFPLQSHFTGRTIQRAKRYPFDHSGKVATLVWGYGEREVISHDTASNYIKAEFEEYQFNIPQNYEDYLKHIYGNYMELPPENERIYKHHSVAAWK